MKKVNEKSIVNIDSDYFDNAFLFDVPKVYSHKDEYDMSKLLISCKNENLDFKKDYKLWSEVYSPKEELRIFKELFDLAIAQDKKIHISNISLSEEIELIKKLYLDLGYFKADLNCFLIDFKNSPITVGVNINNIIFSFKDYKSKKSDILFIPPPREPRHQKSIRSALNSGIISMISLNDISKETKYLKEILLEEKTNPIKLAKCLYHNYIHRGFEIEAGELIVRL